MLLKSLSLINFKNIAQAQLEFSPAINALVGDNGAGKTNVMDAIHYLSLAKSMALMTDRQSVRHQSPFFVIDGALQSDAGSSEKVICSYSQQQAKGVKSLKRNGKEYERLSDHVGVIPTVVITPQDVTLIYDGAEERRRYINSFISQLDSQYLSALIRYNATLAQRNTTLKQRGPESILEIYDQQLIQNTELIYAKRTEIIDKIQPIISEYYRHLSAEHESITLTYRSKVAEGNFQELLMNSRERDRALEHTTVGVHRDDFDFEIEGYPLRKYGSQGQQKSFLIALKLAQYRIVSQYRGERPILLLDDLFDKLDRGRVERLLEIVTTDAFGQIFITDCNKTRLESILSENKTPYSLYEVEGGIIVQKS